MLSKPPGPIAADLPPTEHENAATFREKWKTWLVKAITDTTDKLKSAQERYKRAFDKRLRKQREEIKQGDKVFLRVERKNDKDTRHKLAPIAEGPYKVKSVNNDAKTVVIEYNDRTVENVSRSRVVLAPEPQSMQELQEKTSPMTIHDIVTGLPAPEEDNLKHLLAPAPNVQTDDGQESATEPTRDSQPSPSEPEVPDKSDDDDDPNTADSNAGDVDDTDLEPDEFILEKILAHRKNRSSKHPTAAIGETVYRLRWTGYKPSDDSWEPIINIPRSHVLRYHKRKKLPIPDDIDRAIDG